MSVLRALLCASIGVLFGLNTPLPAQAAPCIEARLLSLEYLELGEWTVNPREPLRAFSDCLDRTQARPQPVTREQLPDLLMAADIALRMAVDSGISEDFLTAADWIQHLLRSSQADPAYQGRALILWARWLDAAREPIFDDALRTGIDPHWLCRKSEHVGGEACHDRSQESALTFLAQAQNELGARDSHSRRWTLEAQYWQGRIQVKSTRTKAAGLQTLLEVLTVGTQPEALEWARPVVAQALSRLVLYAPPDAICIQHSDYKDNAGLAQLDRDAKQTCGALAQEVAAAIDPGVDPGLAERLADEIGQNSARKRITTPCASPTACTAAENARLKTGLEFLVQRLGDLAGILGNPALDGAALAHDRVWTANFIALPLLVGTDADLRIAADVLRLSTSDRAEAYQWVQQNLDVWPGSPYEDAELRRLGALALSAVLMAELQRDPVEQRRWLETAGRWLEKIRDPAEVAFQQDFRSERLSVSAVPVAIVAAARARYHAGLVSLASTDESKDEHLARARQAHRNIAYWGDDEWRSERSKTTTFLNHRWDVGRLKSVPGLPASP